MNHHPESDDNENRLYLVVGGVSCKVEIIRRMVMQFERKVFNKSYAVDVVEDSHEQLCE